VIHSLGARASCPLLKRNNKGPSVSTEKTGVSPENNVSVGEGSLRSGQDARAPREEEDGQPFEYPKRSELMQQYFLQRLS